MGACKHLSTKLITYIQHKTLDWKVFKIEEMFIFIDIIIMIIIIYFLFIMYCDQKK